MGRPTVYSADLAELICRELASGKTLREVCRAEGMPPESTVRLWALDDREGFAAHYTRAREVGYLSIADELLEIVDDGTNDWMERQNDSGGTFYQANGEHIQRSRLRFDARRWLLSKALPKIFGDKVVQEHTGPDGGPVQVQRIELVGVDATSADPE